jgi:putative peptidoglycan lipid II flippase
MILIRYPLVRVLLERGEFNARSTAMVAWGLMWYSAGLVGHCLVEVLSRVFYALHDTKTPVGIGIGAMGLNIGLSFLLSSWFRSIGQFGLGGLALANSLATAVESVILILILRKRLAGLSGRSILDSAWKALIGTAFMGAVILLLTTIFEGRSLLTLLTGVLAGILVYGLVMYLFKVPEFRQILGALKRKFASLG